MRAMLQRMLGLTADEISAYRELIALPSAAAPDLSVRLGTTTDRAAALLGALERHGLATRSADDTGHFVAAAPAIALGALLVQQQNEIRLAELELTALQQIYLAGSAGGGVSRVVDVVHGVRAVADRIAVMQQAAKHEVMSFVKGPPMAVAPDQNPAEEQAVARGVRYRVVTEREVVDDYGGFAQVVATVHPGQQVRTTRSVPLKLLISDRQTALVPITANTSPRAAGALIVHESALLDALVALFEGVWARAVPLFTPTERMAETLAIDELDAKILALLLAGYTDRTAARQLDTSLRTVQRRVHRLMDRTGVRTRMQLGWQTATQGWLD